VGQADLARRGCDGRAVVRWCRSRLEVYGKRKLRRVFFLTTDGGASKSPEGGVGGMCLSYQELFGRLLLFWISTSLPYKDRSNNPGFLVKGIFHIKKYGLYHASKDLHTH
jgi:hypothetical protein